MNEQTKKKIIIVELVLLVLASLFTATILYSTYIQENTSNNEELTTQIHADIDHDSSEEEPEYKIAFTATTNNDHQPLIYQWDFGDGYISTDQHPTHIFKQTGLYQIRVTVSDSYGNRAYDQIIVNVGNTDPLEAKIEVNTWSGFEPLIIYFSATSNKDGNFTYDWEFGPAYKVIVPLEKYEYPKNSFRVFENLKKRQQNIQNTQYSSTLKDPIMVFCYEGLCWAKLKITDDKGTTASDMVWIQVYDSDVGTTVLHNIFNK